MKFKTPSKPVVNMAYYADNKYPVKSQDSTSYSLDLSKERISIIEKQIIQFNENQAYRQSCRYDGYAHSDQSNIIGMVQTGNVRPYGTLEKLRILNSSVSNQTTW